MRCGCMQVAVRSEEPYKLQGYSILKSLSAPDYISDPDATGTCCQYKLCLPHNPVLESGFPFT